MFEKINEDLKSALKSGDKFKLSVLRMLKSALQLEEKNKKEVLTDSDVLVVLKRQVKQRNDSAREYESLGKLETVEELKKEIEIINTYLPEEASIEQINKTIDDAFNKLNPTNMKEMGTVMKYVTENLTNADMTKVSAIVKERLSK
ncbi:MAG: GatB/YqeY domain-containing protein [Firmicutes bacterium]|nr:GatB/YqeY domain-containing protein [Bacillota bacterium]